MHYFEVRFPEVLMDDGMSFSEAIDDAMNEMPVEVYEWLGFDQVRTSGGDGTDLYLEVSGDLKRILDLFIHTLRNGDAPPDTILYVVSDDSGVADGVGKSYRLGDLVRG